MIVVAKDITYDAKVKMCKSETKNQCINDLRGILNLLIMNCHW